MVKTNDLKEILSHSFVKCTCPKWLSVCIIDYAFSFYKVTLRASMNLQNFRKLGMLLTYDWVVKDTDRRPKTLVSEMLTINGHQVIQVGLKNLFTQSKDPLAFLVGINLNRIGLKIEQVFVNSVRTEPTFLTNDENSCLQLFTVRLSSHILPGQHTFKFEILTESQTNDFSYVLCNSPFQSQLWEAYSKGLHNPDITIEVNNATFRAHKAILAARSEEFASKFQESDVEGNKWLSSVVSSGTFSSSVIEQFLKFMYTGILEGSFDNDYLLHLASSFGMESLVKLCQEGSKKIGLRDMGYLLANINPDTESSPAHTM